MEKYTDIQQKGEIAMLKEKCKYAAEELEQIDVAIRDFDLTAEENNQYLRDWVVGLKLFLRRDCK